MDPIATVASACVGAAVYGSLRAVIPFILKRQRNGNGNGKVTSGSLSPEHWELRMKKMHEEAKESVMESMRGLMDARTFVLVEKVTQPIVAEIRGLRDDLGRWERERRA